MSFGEQLRKRREELGMSRDTRIRSWFLCFPIR